MTTCDDRLINLLNSLIVTWYCADCGHGPTRHCKGCGVCHVGQAGKQDPFKEWCGCIKDVPLWVRMVVK